MTKRISGADRDPQGSVGIGHFFNKTQKGEMRIAFGDDG